MINATDYTPRRAIALLTLALGRLDLIQPPGLREPIRHLLRAACELCALQPPDSEAALVGRPLNYELTIAHELVNAATSDVVP